MLGTVLLGAAIGFAVWLVVALVTTLYRAGHVLERYGETEPLVCAHCGEDPDPDGEWFAENVVT